MLAAMVGYAVAVSRVSRLRCAWADVDVLAALERPVSAEASPRPPVDLLQRCSAAA
jgi:hypothetical protein